MNGSPLTKNEYMQKRTRSIGFTMIVMGGSFFLYYLGLFGNVQGPLTPSNIGEALTGIGVTKAHMLLFFLSFFIIAMTWNHLYNLISYLMGSRLTCVRKDDHGKVCGASTRKVKTQAGGKTKIRFTCENGHTCPDASFHPVKKGVVSHTVWVGALMFCIIIAFFS